MGLQKNKNEQISVRSFLWQQARYGSKKNANVPFFFSVGLCFCRWAQKNTQTYGTVHAFRSTVQNLPLRTICAQGGANNRNSEDDMCPRWGK